MGGKKNKPVSNQQNPGSWYREHQKQKQRSSRNRSGKSREKDPRRSKRS